MTNALGAFERGDLISVINSDKQLIARGLTRFSSSEVNKIKGAHSKQIGELLDYDGGAEVLHRDDLILL